MQARMSAWFLAGLVGLAVPAPSPAAEPDFDLAAAEKTLQEAKVPADGPSLVAYFRQRTLSEADQKKLGETVRRLGSEKFAERRRAFQDLRNAGRSALPFVRAARTSPDPETAHSAGRLVKLLESGSDLAVTMAAARVLAARKPPEAVPTLLAYLPMCDDEMVTEAILEALAVGGVREGKVHPALAAALKDRDPVKRLAAAHVHGKAGPASHKELAPLLADPDPRVRYQAAAALVRGGERSAVPPLIALLAEDRQALAWRAEALLFRLAGEKAPQVSLGAGADDQRKCRDAWAAWWQASGPAVDLKKIDLKRALRGLTVVCECGAGKHPAGYVWEYGPGGKVRWEFDNVNTPVDVQPLANGHVLVAEWSGTVITERDRKGLVVWKYPVPNAGMTRSCQRLANGNTFVATTQELREVTRDGRVVRSYKFPENIHRARRLDNGQFLFVSGRGRVVHLDRAGKEIRSLTITGGTGAFADADLLPNGRYLVALYSANKVLELDAGGKELWSVTVQTPSSANRLPNGNTLVTSMDARCVVELDRAGKVVAKQATPGRPFCVRRY